MRAESNKRAADLRQSQATATAAAEAVATQQHRVAQMEDNLAAATQDAAEQLRKADAAKKKANDATAELERSRAEARKAADEMRHRVERLAADADVWLGTFHRFCARLLRRYAPLVGLKENYTIYDTGDSGRALRRVMGRLKIDGSGFTPDTVAQAISWAS